MYFLFNNWLEFKSNEPITRAKSLVADLGDLELQYEKQVSIKRMIRRKGFQNEDLGKKLGTVIDETQNRQTVLCKLQSSCEEFDEKLMNMTESMIKGIKDFNDTMGDASIMREFKNYDNSNNVSALTNNVSALNKNDNVLTFTPDRTLKSKDKAVTGLTSGIEFLLKKNKVDYMQGWGKFTGENTIGVDMSNGSGMEEIKVKNVIIATGSEPTSLPPGILDIDEKYVVTSTGALELGQIPKKMIVVGGGVIGLEMGSVYCRLGSEVTVIQHTDRICPFLDLEISKVFEKILKK